MGRTKNAGILLLIAMVSGAVIFLCILIHFLAFPHTLLNRGLDLHREWEACIESGEIPRLDKCQWLPTDLPDVMLMKRKVGNLHQIIYRKAFATPAKCLDPEHHGCSLVIGGVYQEVEAFLNGRSLGVHFTSFDLYPAVFKIPRDALHAGVGENELLLNVRVAPDAVLYPGVLQEPIGIYSLLQTDFIVDGIVGERIILPIISAAICLIFALISLLWMLSKNSPSKILSDYFLFCLLAAIYMLFVTRLPRELLTEPTANSFNFALRSAMDFGLICLMSSYFGWRGIGIRAFKCANIGVILAFGILTVVCALNDSARVFLSSIYFHNGLAGLREGTYIQELARVCIPAFACSSLIGLWQSFTWVEKEPEDWPLLALFLVLGPMQVMDILTLCAVIRIDHEIYFMRLYTPLVAVAFGYCIWIRWIKRERLAEAAVRVGNVTASVAHDLRSPIAALKVLLHGCSQLATEERAILSQAVQRIESVSKEILGIYKTSLDQKSFSKSLHFEGVILFDLVNEVLEAKRREKFGFERLQLELLCRDPFLKDHKFQGSKSEIVRVIDNLLNNAIDAIRGVEQPKVVVTFFQRTNFAVIEISDNGTGVPSALIHRFENRDFGQTTKEEGNGIGLSYVWRIVQQHRGDLSIRNNPICGATAAISLPITGSALIS